jgi:hypothetical protein
MTWDRLRNISGTAQEWLGNFSGATRSRFGRFPCPAARALPVVRHVLRVRVGLAGAVFEEQLQRLLLSILWNHFGQNLQ